MLVDPKILNPEVGGEIDDQSRARLEDARRHPRGLSVLQTQEHDIPAPRGLGRGGAGKPCSRERRQCRVGGTDRLTGTAAAGGDALSDLRVLQQQPQELSGDVAGPADHCDLHVVESRESRVGNGGTWSGETLSRDSSTPDSPTTRQAPFAPPASNPAASRRALWAGKPRADWM